MTTALKKDDKVTKTEKQDKKEPVVADVLTPPAEQQVFLRKIAMVGTAPSTRGQHPKNTDWEVWTQADYWQDLERVDRWFEFASLNKLEAEFQNYLAYLKEAKFPIYMRMKYPDIPASRAYPFEEMENKFGREFMTATLCWMMCLAITEHMAGHKISHIGLWGYDMAMDGEYAHQRPGIKHMQWICHHHLPALGHSPIQVMVPKGSDLLVEAIPYPFAEDDPMVAKIRARKDDLDKRIAYLNQQIAAHDAESAKFRSQLQYLNGAMEDLTYFHRMACGVKTPAA